MSEDQIEFQTGELLFKGGILLWVEKGTGTPPRTAFKVDDKEMQSGPLPNPEPWAYYNQASRYAFEKWVIWGGSNGKEPWILRWDDVLVSPEEIRSFWGPIFARR